MFRKNVSGQFVHFQGVDAATGGIKSGVTWTVRRCIDGTFAAATGTVTEDGTTGWYKFAMSQADTNGNNIGFNFTGTGAVPQTVNIVTTDANPYDAVRLGLTALPNAAAEAAGGLYTRGTGAGQINQNANGQVDTRTVAMVTDVITAAAIAADAIGASELAADAVTEIRSVASGTSDSGTTTTMVDAARTEADTDYWKGDIIVFTSGTIAGQARLITGFTPASDTITFAPATTQAVGTQTYEIWPAGRADIQLVLGAVINALISGRIDANTQAMANDVITAAVLANGAIDAATFAAGAIDNAAFNVTETLTANPATGGISSLSFAAGAIDAAAIAADAITSSELAQSAAQEIADEVLDRNLAGGGSGNTRNVRNALRALRNKVSESGGTLTVTQEDDIAAAWTAAVVRTASTDPITSVDPA